MKKYLSITFLSLVLVMASCEKFLDIKPIAEKPEADFLNTYDNVSAVIASAYFHIQSADFYGGQYVKISELFGDDIFYDKIPTDYQNRDFSLFSNPGEGLWTAGYKAIYRCNLVINAVDQNLFEIDGEKKNTLKGEALFIRGMVHFQICRLFSQPYSNNPLVDKGITIRIKTLTANEASEPVDVSTIQEVYTQAISDLEASIPLLPTASNSDRATSWAAKGMLAKIYFDMNDFVNCKKYCDEIINSGTFNLGVPTPNVVYPFRNSGLGASNGGVLFQIINYTGFDGGGQIRGDYWSANANTVKYPLNNDPGGIAADIRAIGGARKDSFLIDTTSITPAINFTSYKKWRGSSISGGPANIPVIRLAEMFLDRAECFAQLGDFAGARNDLNSIRTAVGLPAINATEVADADLLERIRKERHVELALEGDRFHELRRLKLTSRGFVYNSDKLLQIPLSEINGNPHYGK